MCKIYMNTLKYVYYLSIMCILLCGCSVSICNTEDKTYFINRQTELCNSYKIISCFRITCFLFALNTIIIIYKVLNIYN